MTKNNGGTHSDKNINVGNKRASIYADHQERPWVVREPRGGEKSFGVFIERLFFARVGKADCRGEGLSLRCVANLTTSWGCVGNLMLGCDEDAAPVGVPRDGDDEADDGKAGQRRRRCCVVPDGGAGGAEDGEGGDRHQCREERRGEGPVQPLDGGHPHRIPGKEGRGAQGGGRGGCAACFLGEGKE